VVPVLSLMGLNGLNLVLQVISPRVLFLALIFLLTGLFAIATVTLKPDSIKSSETLQMVVPLALTSNHSTRHNLVLPPRTVPLVVLLVSPRAIVTMNCNVLLTNVTSTMTLASSIVIGASN